MQFNYFSLLIISLLFSARTLTLTAAGDTISLDRPIADPESILSKDEFFRFGFFTPSSNSSNRYVGVWYNKVPKMTVIWVANRNTPLNDSSGSVTIDANGNLQLLDGRKQVIWSSGLSAVVRNSTAEILDSGNLVLREDSNANSTLWESFQNPTDSFLQGMRISIDLATGEERFLTSWKTPTNPTPGEFVLGLDARNVPDVVIWNGSSPHWRSGPWSRQIIVGSEYMISLYYDSIRSVGSKLGEIYLTFSITSYSGELYFLLASDGNLQQMSWAEGMDDWEAKPVAITTDCWLYGKCGPNGICDSKSFPICSCLRGFEPENEEEWRIGNFNRGCKRKTPLQCERNETNGDVNKDGFLETSLSKLPDFAIWSSENDKNSCGNRCLENCSCLGYTFYDSVGCLLWNRSFVDLQRLDTGGTVVHSRVAYSELGRRKKDMKALIAVVSVIIGSLLLIAILVFFAWKFMKNRRGRTIANGTLQLRNWPFFQDHANSPYHNTIENSRLEELPLFNFHKLLAATNNFDGANNKLGEGGFGPVYKGILEDGRAIAVKRLSKSSSQGMEEFMNEVRLISMLQHRNLVKLLGCCVDCDEKMLVYEYLPNKSLDFFLFDPNRHELSDWRKRSEIIDGIGRGILYLHRDSRLRIIHRDLKASNILLDEDLNPKISDFGMARIFGVNEDQQTKRVVGTYGYMAPEYAMAGRFSEKSDVFSFGILLLEIVSGKKNSSCTLYEQPISLVGLVWKLWKANNIASLVDPRITGKGFEEEILRCVHVALLCVEDLTTNRPTISTALSMLSSDIVNLPEPIHPGFTEAILIPSNTESSNGKDPNKGSTNELTITTIQGR